MVGPWMGVEKMSSQTLPTDRERSKERQPKKSPALEGVREQLKKGERSKWSASIILKIYIVKSWEAQIQKSWVFS